MIQIGSMALCLLVTAGSSGPQQDLRLAESSKALILCDGSAGSVEEAEVWTQVLAAEKPRVVMLSGDADLNAFDLPAGDWPIVFLFARHRGMNTAWLEPLRAFALDHPKSRVHLFLWKSPNELPDEGKALFATTAMAIWWNGFTTVGYVGTKNDDPKSLRAKSVKGVVVPDFEGVVLAEPSLRPEIARMQRPTRDQLRKPAGESKPLTDCQMKRAITYRDRSLRCVQEDQERQQDCIELYAPQGDDPGDFDALGRCIQEASEDLANSLAAAGRDCRRGMALCEKRHGAAPASADPNPK